MKNINASATLILLHGWATQPSCWNSLEPILPKTYSLKRLLLPGHRHNHSQNGQPNQPATWAQYSDYLDELYQTTPVSATWLGWSLGGMVAQQLAGRYPHHIGHLICVAAPLRFYQADDWPNGLNQSENGVTFAQLFTQQPQQALHKFWQLMCVGDLSAEHKTALQAMLNAKHKPQELSWALEVLAQHDVRQDLKHYHGAITFIGGDQDPIVSARCLRDSQQCLSHSHCSIIAGAGHALPLSHTATLAEILSHK